MKVAICAITFTRPDGLRRLLGAINALTFQDEPPEIEIVIIDNDEDRSAQAVCDEMRAELRWPLRYDVEPQRGIPYARNKAVESALDIADFIAFIDDDEIPEPEWLDELVRVQRRYEADVVTGPVVAEFEETVPSWVVRGGFFETPRHPTGRRMDVAYTHNVIVRSEVLRALGRGFDNRLALTGGEDSHLFRRVHAAGYSIVWADEAIVTETIPASRACFSWLVKRFYRIGNTRGLISIDLGSALLTRLLLVAKSIAWIVIGVTVTVAGMFWGRHAVVIGLRYIAYGLGMLSSIPGIRYEEYRVTHGT